jgi:hypothetical protein
MPTKPVTDRENAEKNRLILRKILITGGITHEEAAKIITEETGRKCSSRTVRAWLIDPSSPSSRACPAWAITELKRALLRQTNR